jgi:hypothetical protein
MLAWKVMRATSAACESICMQMEAADHYGYRYSLWHRWSDWWRGFVVGWLGDHEYHTPVTQRALRLFRRVGRNARRIGKGT